MKKNYRLRVPYSVSIVLLFLLFSTTVISQNLIALQKIKNYVSENQQRLGLTQNDVATLSISHEYTDVSTGVHHIYATQKINGLTVTNSGFSLHSVGEKNFETNQLVGTSKLSVQPLSLKLSSQDAVLKLMSSVNYSGEKNIELKQAAQGTDQVTVYKRGTSAVYDIPCRLVYYNNQKLSTLRAAWEVQMMDINRKHYWLGYIDANTGKILEKRDLIMHCEFGGAETDQFPTFHKNHQHKFVEESGAQTAKPMVGPGFDAKKFLAIAANKYRVYDMPLESPGDTIQQAALHELSSRAGDPLASPDGWHRISGSAPLNYTQGNNVHSFYDPSPGPLGGVPNTATVAYANNGVGGLPPATEPFIFDYPINLADDPAVYQKAAIVNLFYWNNLMHDVFYHLGFTAEAGNFEQSHVFSNGVTRSGGAPGDPVLAQAQDGGGTNNANFLTLPDGVPGSAQMQMYLWTASIPDSLVQIISSTSGVPPAGKKYFAVQGSFSSSPLANTNLFTNPVENREFVIVQKNPLSTVGTSTEGCSTGQQSVALPPGNNVQDKIVLIDRGSCSFVEKVYGAQLGGAAGAIVINNTPGAPIAMGGSDAPGNLITIPAVMISLEDGKELKAQLQGGSIIRGSLKANNPPAPKRDGDLDNGVIAHEYGHGISSRLTAPNTLGPLGGDEQGGEGWSDFMALYMTLRQNDLLPATAEHPKGVLPVRSIGNYVTYQPAEGRGIRPTPYSLNRSVNPSTFKDIAKGGEITVPHGVGYIWCTMLYGMMQSFIDQYGMGDNVYEGAVPVNNAPPTSAGGNNIAMRLILEGIKLQGTSPTFQRQRDAILEADSMLYKGMHSCMIWKAFASRGLGFSAKSNTNGLGDEVEAFDIPYACDPSQRRVRIEKGGPVKSNNGSQVNYSIKVKNILPTAITGLLVTDTLPEALSFVAATNSPTLEGNVVKWTLDLAGGDSVLINLTTQLSSTSSSIQTFGDDHEAVADSFVAANMGGLDTWTRQTNSAMAFSGSKYWFVPDTDLGGSNTTLTTRNLVSVPPNAELVFIHKFATESDYDGGVVEVSTNPSDPTSWVYLPPSKFVKGGYTGVISALDNPGIGTADLSAFTGASPGYIVSIAKLDDYANQNISIRFRFTTDAAGGSVEDGGWWMDDVYVLLNRTEVVNEATAITTPTAPVTEMEGTNAQASTSSFILGGTALPNNLGALVANVSSGSLVNLVWSTYNEINTEAFEVERKAPSDRSFRKIATVTPAANGAGTKSYNFSDPNVLAGKYQYRIKQVNKGGEFYYTNVANINIGGKAFVADIYPNPATSVANLSIVNPAGGKVTINLFDVSGKKIGTYNGAEAASQVIALPVTGLKAGTYWVEVNTNENHATLKLVVK